MNEKNESQVSNRLLDYSPDRRIVGEGRAGEQSRVGGVESNPSRAESPGYFVTIENSEATSSSGKFRWPELFGVVIGASKVLLSPCLRVRGDTCGGGTIHAWWHVQWSSAWGTRRLEFDTAIDIFSITT